MSFSGQLDGTSEYEKKICPKSCLLVVDVFRASGGNYLKNNVSWIWGDPFRFERKWKPRYVKTRYAGTVCTLCTATGKKLYPKIALHEVNRICVKSMKNPLATLVQLNGYEWDSYIFSSIKSKLDIGLFVDFCAFTCFYQLLPDVIIILFCRSKQNNFMITSCKNSAINKQSYVNFRLNWIKFGDISYLLSCTSKYFGPNWKLHICEVRLSIVRLY